MPNDLRALLLVAVRASAVRGPHADAARQVVLAIVFAQILAGAGHAGPPHAAARPPRRVGPRRDHRARRRTVTGRRPRG